MGIPPIGYDELPRNPHQRDLDDRRRATSHNPIFAAIGMIWLLLVAMFKGVRYLLKRLRLAVARR
jgi:hypothetical protein